MRGIREFWTGAEKPLEIRGQLSGQFHQYWNLKTEFMKMIVKMEEKP